MQTLPVCALLSLLASLLAGAVTASANVALIAVSDPQFPSVESLPTTTVAPVVVRADSTDSLLSGLRAPEAGTSIAFLAKEDRDGGIIARTAATLPQPSSEPSLIGALALAALLPLAAMIVGGRLIRRHSLPAFARRCRP